MQTREEALKYGLSFPDTYQNAPFHDDNWQLVRYKHNKKAFLWTYEKDGYINLNVKVDPENAFCMPKVNHFCNLLFPPAMFSIVLFLIFPWGKPCHFTESLDKIAG